MPFIDQLKHWALQQPDHPAVIAGAHSLSYSQLLRAAQEVPRPAQPGVSVIDVPTGTDLVVQYCAAVLQGRTVMVLDAGWPGPLRRRLRDLAVSWDERSRAEAGPGGGMKAPPFLLGLSSGTSGTPKAFLRSAVSWRESFAQSGRYFSLNETTRTLAPGPLAASMNLYALGETLFAGGTFLALPHFSPDAALAALVGQHANRLVLVPAVLDLMARRGLATGVDGQALTHIVCAGASLSTAAGDLAHAWAPAAVVQQYYGAAELGFVTATEVAGKQATVQGTDKDGAGIDGVGRPFPGVQLSIRNGDGTELPTGETGLVSVKSAYICDGYAWGDDGLAFAPLSNSGWSTVHDLGSLDRDGVLHLAGRAGDMIITSGNNVYPHAVEHALQRDVAGADVVVTGIPDRLRGQRVIAAVHLRAGTEGETPSVEPIMALLRRNAATLPAAHRPARYVELAALPLTGSGKISRALLAGWILDGDPRVQPDPRSQGLPRSQGGARVHRQP